MGYQLLGKLAKPKMLLVFSVLYSAVMFLLANIVLAFIQALVVAFQQFQVDQSLTLQMRWQSMWDFQKDILPFYLAFAFLSLIGLIKFIYKIRMSYTDLNEGQHGTSEFEQMKQLKKQYKIIPAAHEEYDGDGGIIISALQEKGRPYRLLIDNGPVHTIVIGITRSGKGETFVFPMIDVQSRSKNKPSLVVNDPKGELAAASYDTLIARGYDVYVFNLLQQYMGMGFNPLTIVVDAWKKGDSSLAQQYANSVAFMLYNDPNAKDPFWNNSAKSLVTAIILALVEDSLLVGREETVNLYSVANFLATLGSDTDEETEENALDLFFRERDENNPARMMYATSNFAAGNTRASIFSTAMDKLQIFTLEPNAKMTSYNSLDLTEIGFGDKPIAVFMVTPDFDESNHVLSSIFISQMYRVNAEKATLSPSGKMKRQVHALLDEVGNMPAIDGLSSMVTVGAGRGFRFHLIIQAYSQLKGKYGENDADTIIGNCSNQIYILTKDEGTAKQFSSMVGTKTITDISRSGNLLSMDKTHSESTKERELLKHDELMQLLEGESVVVRSNKRQDNKFKKIKPKPIFNTGKTAAKFRHEYLADDFDNSKSILNLPILSPMYHRLKMSDIVFTSKTDRDLYIRMKYVMGNKVFEELTTILHTFVPKDYMDEMEQWSFLHLLSFLAYTPELEMPKPVEAQIFKRLEKYLSQKTLEMWRNTLHDQQEKWDLENEDEEESLFQIQKQIREGEI
ncbi:VirD4-like conjugal transfer protein, CD1115 family [Metasolibacillus sp.]|uniref:VirD4-like conjugal transfer protein, CD1115 family n=1 Tax=Metasolibacillus sp. TaxID=2703680 RepID=UPI0025E03CE8|nr:type IV secretory system conjugative DNA transfer family protein [Metasolibacillus sp.]MCT6922808.1 type IV secretory system conjugative DNA transfer family protein [Metasolibacillus sp.]MCT6938853.1 type IV secretory system conjugative DNA transfer family protein [Metasolibacillus sp.]